MRRWIVMCVCVGSVVVGGCKQTAVQQDGQSSPATSSAVESVGRTSAPVVLTESNFESIVLKAETLAMVDFYADWCPPCRTQGPIVDEIAKEFGDTIIVGKVNVDNNPTLSQKYEIRGIPTIIFFQGGAVAQKLVGLNSKETLISTIKNISNK